jgi:glycosyltransferase involved in cell wall biosynthesis
LDNGVDRLKILFLAPQPFFTNRGTPIAVRAALQALAAQGHIVDVLSYHEGEDVRIDSVSHHRTVRPPFVKRVPIGPSWQKALCDLAMTVKAVSMARRNSYGVIHAVEESAFIAWLIRILFGVPYIFDMDSLMSLQIIEKSKLLTPIAWVFAWMERRTVRRSQGVLAVCPALVDEALRHHPTGNVALLPDIPFTGSDQTNLPEALTQATGTRLMYVGNLEGYQGIDLMLDAFARVADEHKDTVLLIVGGSQEHIEQYKAKAGALCEKGRVVFVGPVPIDSLGAVLGFADILVSPRTQGNNTPMKVYSYLQSGKPVVATRLSTHTQVMNDDVSVLVEPNAPAMADGMSRLIGSPELRQTIGQAGRAYVEREFSEQRFRERLQDFYDTLGEPSRSKVTQRDKPSAA